MIPCLNKCENKWRQKFKVSVESKWVLVELKCSTSVECASLGGLLKLWVNNMDVIW